MRTNNDLLSELEYTGILQTDTIKDAVAAIDRGDFVLPVYRADAYDDYPLPIGAGQTISQPTTVVFMLELLQPKAQQHILDIGAGSGWTTALLAHIVGEQGRVIGTERVPELVEFGNSNLATYSFDTAQIIDPGAALGCPQEAPYDRILVSAAARELPQELVDQLCVGGVMVIPVLQSLWKVEKTADGSVEIEKFPGFSFVPLLGQT